MFGLSKEKPATASDRAVGRDGEHYPEHLETLAQEAGKIAAAKADELAATYADEHQRQLAEYAFDCRRHGDFLSLFITRSANKPSKWQTSPEHATSYSTTINLGRVKAIQLAEGHGPDRGLTLGFSVSMKHEGGGISWGTGGGTYAPPKGAHYKVSPSYPHLPESRSSFFLEPEPSKDSHQWSGMMMNNGDYSIKHKMSDFPRPAEDDKIEFDGLGATLFTPHSKGKDVLAAILAEIERAAP